MTTRSNFDLVMDVRCACRGATSTGARCRNMVDGYGRCGENHQRDAAQPNTVLLKIRVSRKKLAILRAEGIEIRTRTAQDDQRHDATHSAEAAKHRRQATSFRSRPDSGVPVFGKEGAQNVRVDGVGDELERAGYRVASVHVYQRPEEISRGMGTLVMEYSLTEEAAPNVPAAAPNMFDDACYGFVHVWVNPPKDDGAPTHTVNISHREPNRQPTAQLIWEDGFWALASVD